jgi:acetyl esterase/lipase
MKRWIYGLLMPAMAGCVSVSGPVEKPPALPAAQSVLSGERVTYTASDAPAPLQATVTRPEGAGPFPAVVLIHGGGWTGGKPQDMAKLAERLAEQGFVAFNIAYRLAPGDRYPAQIDDVATALDYLRANAAALQVDPKRIGVWGYSAGAHLAALAGTRLPKAQRPQAVVAGGLPADLRKYPKSPLIAKLMGTTLQGDTAGWTDASPIAHVDASSAPMWLYHGTWDWIVGVDNAREMHAALEAAGVESTLYLISGYGHFATFLWSSGAEDGAIQFLRRQLKVGG